MGLFLTYFLVFAVAETGQFGLDNATHHGLSMFDNATHHGLSMLDGATHPGLRFCSPLRYRNGHWQFLLPSPRGDGAAARHFLIIDN